MLFPGGGTVHRCCYLGDPNPYHLSGGAGCPGTHSYQQPRYPRFHQLQGGIKTHAVSHYYRDIYIFYQLLKSKPPGALGYVPGGGNSGLDHQNINPSLYSHWGELFGVGWGN